jgi:CheY-like chemotaxis protein
MKKALIVDDSKVLIHTLQKGFEKYQDSFQAIYAENGLEAMNILDQEPFSLVVTDIQMPMIDGLVLLAFIRERYPDLPCIIISSYGSDELKDQVNRDILHFIDKPFKVDELAKIILSALKNPKGQNPKRISIYDLLYLIIFGRKTCIFKIMPEDGQSGYYYFNKGELYNAIFGKLKGEEAVIKMLTYENAKVVFTKPPKHAGRDLVNVDINKLIQQAKSSKLSIDIEKKVSS